MEEILTLKLLLLKGDLKSALALVEELEEMSRGQNNAIESYAVILLLHLIKQQAEKRTTRSWDVSIRNSVRTIQKKNNRRLAGGFYLTTVELKAALDEAYPEALDAATLEVDEGRYDSINLAQLVNQQEVLERALTLIWPEQQY